MKIANSLWAVVERSGVDGTSFVMSEEVFNSRQKARDYLYTLKNERLVDRPRSLFIRRLRVTNSRG